MTKTQSVLVVLALIFALYAALVPGLGFALRSIAMLLAMGLVCTVAISIIAAARRKKQPR